MESLGLTVAGMPASLIETLEGVRAELDQHWSSAQRQQLQQLLDPVLTTELAQVLACSPWVAQQFTRQPALLLELLGSGDIHRCYMRGIPDG